jgi:hypothetical protein
VAARLLIGQTSKPQWAIAVATSAAVTERRHHLETTSASSASGPGGRHVRGEPCAVRAEPEVGVLGGASGAWSNLSMRSATSASARRPFASITRRSGSKG